MLKTTVCTSAKVTRICLRWFPFQDTQLFPYNKITKARFGKGKTSKCFKQALAEIENIETPKMLE